MLWLLLCLRIPEALFAKPGSKGVPGGQHPLTLCQQRRAWPVCVSRGGQKQSSFTVFCLPQEL